MEQDTKECSVLDREKDLVSTRTQMVTSTKVNGKTISVRAKEPSSTLKAQPIEVTSVKANAMVMACTKI